MVIIVVLDYKWMVIKAKFAYVSVLWKASHQFSYSPRSRGKKIDDNHCRIIASYIFLALGEINFPLFLLWKILFFSLILGPYLVMVFLNVMEIKMKAILFAKQQIGTDGLQLYQSCQF